jgi:hypothetical protein
VLPLGDTVTLLPVPTNVPPQEPEYQVATAPVPAEPPTKVKTVEPPAQMVVVPEMLVGATDSVFTVTACDAQVVVLQVPSYLTK